MDMLPVSRKLVFSAAAKADLEKLIEETADTAPTFAAELWDALKPELKKIAALRYVTEHENVCRIACIREQGGSWYRYKDSDHRVRVAFELTVGMMTVHAILVRASDTYEVIEARFTQKVAA